MTAAIGEIEDARGPRQPANRETGEMVLLGNREHYREIAVWRKIAAWSKPADPDHGRCRL